jgi:hypothetical protein
MPAYETEMLCRLMVLAMALLPGFDMAIAAGLTPETTQAFERHIRTVEAQVDRRLASGQFLWLAEDTGRLQSLRAGQILAEPAAQDAETPVPHGLIHDWLGAVFIPGVTLPNVISAVQDYDRHKVAYGPEVVDSRLLSRTGNDFHVYLRLRKKKVITVTLNTEHDVRYQPIDATRYRSRSYSTRIAEVANAGSPGERELPVGEDHGFLWRLDSYWRFEERDGGVYVECEAVSLTRDIPAGLGWLIAPVIRDLPRESLIATLTSTRNYSLTFKTR